MKTYKNLYKKICSIDNLILAYKKARKGKSKRRAVIDFDEHNLENLLQLQKELIDFSYRPHTLKKSIIRDPKIRTIHASIFKDRIVHHAIVAPLEIIFEKIFICDSYASRKNKGAHLAIKRFEEFQRKVSQNGLLIGGGGGGEKKKI